MAMHERITRRAFVAHLVAAAATIPLVRRAVPRAALTAGRYLERPGIAEAVIVDGIPNADQVRLLYSAGVNQTIVRDRRSSTGYFCTRWDDANQPWRGRHFRPSRGGPGAPCDASGVLRGPGLELPPPGRPWGPLRATVEQIAHRGETALRLIITA